MPAPDARTRNKISLNPSKVLATSIPSKLVPRILLSNALFVFAVHASKEWLLNFDVGVFWVVMRVLACGGLGVLVWEGITAQTAKRRNIEWSALGMASLLQFVQCACLFTAIYRLSSPRVILFAHFSTYWMGSLLSPSSTRKTMSVAGALLISVLSDTQLSAANFWLYAPGYGALLLHAFSSSALEHTLAVLSPSLGTTFSTAASLKFPPTPILPLISLACIPAVAYSLLFFTPLTMQSLNQLSFKPQHFGFSFPTLVILPTFLVSLPLSKYQRMYPESIDTITAVPRTPTSRLIRSYVKTILANPESRKIFYFLMLNLCYMLVQMLYGVWTNSLGLISDAIHMAFDCMAIGMGLFASVMATWDPNERFTYGYGRIETLSGFANGIFLILISIFIMFEAIQRILEPPEMNTSQLLLVSSLGLAVNLFGMFAMGGHHHHGGHSHSHGHSHASHDEDHSAHTHDHNHVVPPNSAHSHSHSALSPSPLASSHSHSHSPPPLPLSASHPHSHAQSHSSPQHSPMDCDDHSHAPHESHSHSHGHDEHAHQHSPTEHAHSHSHTHSHNEHSNDITPSAPHPSSHSRSMSTSSVSERPTNGDSRPTKRHSRGPSISIDLAGQAKLLMRTPLSPSAMTPLTPNYTFGHDDHYTKHHDSKHLPNLHEPSHAHLHEGHSHNMRGVFLHVMADTLGSVGVIISTLLIQFYGWTGFDPIASLFIAILIAASVIPLVMDTGKVLALDVADRDVDIRRALSELSSIEGLASYTSPRFWPKDSSSLIGSIHIQLEPSGSSHDPTGPHSSRATTYTKADRVVERVDTLLRQKIPGLEELTIQIEGKQVMS
ncbi:cation efflux family-domain-containing protein [Flammula alnicola]|nr:cation efflux family-domain-containing protein [Flammula alnicola]